MQGTSLASWSPLALRIVLGITFLAHGSQKLFGAFGSHGLSQLAQGVEKMGFYPGSLWAFLVASCEFFGGLLVLLGAAAEIGAAMIIPVMLVAIWKVHGPNGFFITNSQPGFEYNFMILGACVALILSGPGPLALFDPFHRWRQKSAAA